MARASREFDQIESIISKNVQNQKKVTKKKFQTKRTEPNQKSYKNKANISEVFKNLIEKINLSRRRQNLTQNSNRKILEIAETRALSYEGGKFELKV